MVNDLSRFREAFAAHQDQFALIGGAAASEWFDQAGLPFRATKDLDIVLLLESLDDSRHAVPQRVHDDLGRFLGVHGPTSDVWQEIMAAVERTARIEEPSEAVQVLRQAFVTSRP